MARPLPPREPLAMLHEPRAEQEPGRALASSLVRQRWAALLGCALGGLGLIASLIGCNMIVGASAAVVLGGAGVLAAQCYDQVSVHVHDELGVPTCDARVSVGQGDSFHSLRPCYHASLTSGTWRFAAQQDGYEPAQVELTVPERKGACPHYTHSLELTLRRIGAPREAPFAATKAAPATPAAPAAPRTRPALRLGPPVGAATPVAPAASVAPAAPVAPGALPPAPPPAPAPPPVPPGVPPLPEPREAP